MEVTGLKMEDKYKPLTESTYYVMIAFLYEKHGYAIKMFLEDKTHGRISLGPGTLYGIINKLNEKESSFIGYVREPMLVEIRY